MAQEERDKALAEVGTWTDKRTFSSSIHIDDEDFSDFVEAQQEVISDYLEGEWGTFVHERYQVYMASIVNLCNRSHRETMRLIEIEDAWSREPEEWTQANGCSRMETAQ